MRKMETIQDLIEEAKVRFLWWGICIFAVTYFLSHTSKSMLMNIPIAVLIALALRQLANEVDFRWKVSPNSKRTYLSHLEKKQISTNDPRLSTVSPPPKWRRKFDSPVIEAAAEGFVDKIIQDFVSDLWYGDITPDKEAPDLMHAIILEALGEVAGRVKEVNLVDLLTRDIVDLIGDHLELFRKTQASIGVDVMVTLSSEERDERLKHHLMTAKALHPALISSESEYKFLQRLVAGLLGVVLKPKEAQCPLVRCIAREFVTCLVIQPIMNLVSPAYINQLVELILLHVKEFLAGSDGDDHSKADHERSVAEGSIESGAVVRHTNINIQQNDMPLAGKNDQKKVASEVSPATSCIAYHNESMQPKVADWARVLDAATQRRTEVLAPDNLENMWAIGRHYKDKINKSSKGHVHLEPDKKIIVESLSGSNFIDQVHDGNMKKIKVSHNVEKDYALSTSMVNQMGESDVIVADGNKHRLKRSSSTSDLKVKPEEQKKYTGEGKELMIAEDFYTPDFGRQSGVYSLNDVPRSVLHAQGSSSAKLRCRVIGAYFEKIGSKSFAVYSIAVSDAQNNTWFVKRRYRNFERLHRLLKDIPNYNLQLPPKRIFSSSTEDAFVHRRCVKLDKYLQDLLSIANVAEQHEVWDFLSASSKNYSFGKSASVMKTLAVNVDDAVDDIVRQFKGVSDGLARKVSSTSSHYVPVASEPVSNLSVNELDFKMNTSLDASMETSMSVSDNEEGNGSQDLAADSSGKDSAWHSDNELKSKSFPTRVVGQTGDFTRSYTEKSRPLEMNSDLILQPIDDPVGVPPEWTPPNVSVPMLNLVDKVFQLNRRGWIRRQVFWISKQILQIIMEDAVDDWLLRQINWLRREDVVAEGIYWIKDILWPDGKFFLKLEITGGGLGDMDSTSFQATPRAGRSNSLQSGSFEMELEAIRRASYVKKMLYNGAPAPLVSLVGQKQYKRCARDIYFFLQSSVCLKQVAYAVLELLLVSVFPELKDLVADIHQKTPV